MDSESLGIFPHFFFSLSSPCLTWPLIFCPGNRMSCYSSSGVAPDEKNSFAWNWVLYFGAFICLWVLSQPVLFMLSVATQLSMPSAFSPETHSACLWMFFLQWRDLLFFVWVCLDIIAWNCIYNSVTCFSPWPFNNLIWQSVLPDVSQLPLGIPQNFIRSH